MYKITTNHEEGQVPEITQSLDELAREGARRMILAAPEVEVEQYVQALRHWRDEQGHAMVVRMGKLASERCSWGQAQMHQVGPPDAYLSTNTPLGYAASEALMHNI